MLSDCLGNTITLHDAGSVSAVNDFVEGFIACEARAVNVLRVAQTDPSPIVQAYCAALHMFSESRDGPASARPFIDTALKGIEGIGGATPRERRFVTAIEAWIHGDISRAIQLHEEQAQAYPRDLASLKLGQYHLFNRGDSPGMLRMALAVLPHAAEVPYTHGMAAFAWEQCHLLAQAEAAARKAIRMCRKEPWAHHALAHVLLTTGRIHEGQAFMHDVSPTWTGLNSFMVTHNWWHQALFALELGHHDEVLQLYDTQVWGVVKEYSQDQIGAVSLLARLELAGVDVGSRWQDVGNHLASRLDDHVLPFLDMQYLYGLARSGRQEAFTLMRHIETHSAGNSDTWKSVAVPASRGLLAHAQGDYAPAVQELGTALPRMMEIGGSHAQRDLFEQIYLDALMHTGQWVAAQNIVQQKLLGQPESARLKRQAAQIYSALGLAAVWASLV